jgi:translation initiation factor 5B
MCLRARVGREPRIRDGDVDRKRQEADAIRIEQKRNMKEYTLGRHWSHESLFMSKLNREYIDLLKEHFRDDVPKDDMKLVVTIKKLLGIM